MMGLAGVSGWLISYTHTDLPLTSVKYMIEAPSEVAKYTSFPARPGSEVTEPDGRSTSTDLVVDESKSPTNSRTDKQSGRAVDTTPKIGLIHLG